MNVDFHSISTGLIVLSTGLSSYLLALRVKDAFAEKPDPKLTYATIKQLNHLSQNLKHHEKETHTSIHNLRLEVKNDHLIRDHSSNNSNEAIHSIIRKVLQDVAKLTAQNQITHHRISELSLKTDKLIQQNNNNKN